MVFVRSVKIPIQYPSLVGGAPRRFFLIGSTAILSLLTSHEAFAQSCNASNQASLATCIANVNAGTATNINVTANITLTNSALPVLTGSGANNVTITGNNNTISGNGHFRVLFVDAGARQVALQDLTIDNGLGGGGNGAQGGGGGLGAGGALFINSGAVTIQNVGFSNNQAQGGTGGSNLRGTNGSTTGTAQNLGGAGGGGGGFGGDGGEGGQGGGGGGGGFSGGGGGGGSLNTTAGGSNSGRGGNGGNSAFYYTGNAAQTGGAGGTFTSGASGGNGQNGNGYGGGGGGAGAGNNNAGLTAGLGGNGGGANGACNPAGTTLLTGCGGNHNPGATSFSGGGGGGGGGAGAGNGGSSQLGAGGGGGGGLGNGGGANAAGSGNGGTNYSAGFSGGLGTGGGGGAYNGGTGGAGGGFGGGGGAGIGNSGSISGGAGGWGGGGGGGSSHTIRVGKNGGLGGFGAGGGGGGAGGSTGAVPNLPGGSGGISGFGATSGTSGTSGNSPGNGSVTGSGTGGGGAAFGGAIFLRGDGTASLTIADGTNFSGNGVTAGRNGNTFNANGTLNTAGSTTSVARGGDIWLGNDVTFNLGSDLVVTGGLGGGAADACTTNCNVADINGGIIKNGAGGLVLSNGTSTYRGDTRLNQGSLEAGTTNNTFSAYSQIQLADGTIVDLNNTSQRVGSIADSTGATGTSQINLGIGVLTAGLDNRTSTYSGTLLAGGGTAAFIKDGTGTLTLTGNNNLSSFAVRVDAGTLIIANNSAVAQDIDVTVNTGATYDIGNLSRQIRSLTGNQVAGIGGTFQLGNNPATVLSIGGANRNTTYEGSIAGQGSIVKIGTSTQILNGASTYTQGTEIQGGILGIGNNASLGSGGLIFNEQNGNGATLRLEANGLNAANNITLTSGGTIDTNGNNGTISGAISGGVGNGLIKTGLGNLTLDDTTLANSYQGGTRLDGGSVTVTHTTSVGTGTLTYNGANTSLILGANNLTLANGIALNSNGILNSNGNDGALTGRITGANELIKSGNGNVTLNDTLLANNYTGGTRIQGGSITATHATSIGTGTLTFDNQGGGSIALQVGNSNLTFANDVTLTSAGTLNLGANNATFTGQVTGTGVLTKTGTGTLTLNESGAASTFSGGLRIQGGTVAAAHASAIGTGALTFDNQALGSATLQLTGNGGNFALGNAVTLTSSGTLDLGTNNATLTGQITGGAGQSLTKRGAGTLVLDDTALANLYAGGTQLEGGTLAVTQNTSLGTGGLNFNGAGTALQINNNNLNFANAVTLTSAGNINTNGNGATLSGQITGAGTLAKSGTGTLILDDTLLNNTATGATLLQGGTLVAQNASSLGSGGVTFDDRTAAGVTLRLNGTNTVLNGLTLTSGGTLDTGANNASINGAISGAAGQGLIKNGTGTLTLNDTTASSFQGGIRLDGGRLAVTRSTSLGTGTLTFNGANTSLQLAGNALNLTNAITLSADGLIDTNGNNATLSGAINENGGARSLTKDGAGALTISGATKTYSGGTTIQDGTLILAAGIAGPVTIHGGAANGTLRTDIANALQASADITLVGSATFDLNNHDQTIARLGSASANSNVTLGSANLTIGRNAIGNTTLDGQITGSGNLRKTGTDTVTFTGNNSYSGGTIIDGGAFILSGQIAGPVTVNNGATLRTDAAAALTGNANVSVANGGTFNLNNNSQSIGALSGAGQIQLGNARLTLGNATNSTFSGVISDGGAGGALTKNGTGTLILSGINTYTGSTDINAGQLILTGRIAGPANVNASAGLSGTGRIANDLINNGGRVSPGTSAQPTGTLTVDGNYTQNANGSLAITLAAPSSAARLQVGGAATLDGSLDVTPGGGGYRVGQVYTILDAATVTGTFANLNNPRTAFVVLQESYSANQVVLTVTATGNTLATYCKNINQCNTGGAIDQLIAAGGGSPDFGTVSANLNTLQDNQVENALQQLTGEFHNATTLAIRRSNDQYRALVLGRLNGLQGGDNIEERTALGFGGSGDDFLPAAKEETHASGAWIKGYGTFGEIDSNKKITGADYTIGGLGAGLDTDLSDHWKAGLAVGYNHIDSLSKEGNDQSQIDDYQIAIYGRREFEDLYVEGLVGYALHDINTNRTIRFAAIDRNATSDRTDHSALTAWEIGMPVRRRYMTFTPHAGLDYAHQFRSPLNETGAQSLNLRGGGQDDDSLKLSAGLRLSGLYKIDDIAIEPYIDAAYGREILDNRPTFTANLAGGTESYSIYGPSEERNFGIFSAGIVAHVDAQWSVFAGYNGDISETGTDHGVTGGFRLSW